MEPKAIVTMAPYAPFMDEVIRHPIVSGIRLNTVMPVKDSLDDVVARMSDNASRRGKDFWVDLKCRQLRVKDYGVPPFTEIELTHDIELDTPAKAYFSDGRESATVLEVDKNRLIMQEGPKRVVGPGESINIRSNSLKVDGYFTDTDKRYIDACMKRDVHNYMLSFVEHTSDVTALREADNNSNAYLKIESKNGLDFVEDGYQHFTEKDNVHLMTARGDLHVELDMPHYLIGACEKVIAKDKAAGVASRIFSSLSYRLEPSCEDISDADNLLRMGYRTLMLGDDICQERDPVISGLNLLQGIAERYS